MIGNQFLEVPFNQAIGLNQQLNTIKRTAVSITEIAVFFYTQI